MKKEFQFLGASWSRPILAIVFLTVLGVVYASSDTIEGPGFSTPEDAARAYLAGLRDQDITTMLSVFAIESYVDHFDFEKQVERLGSYMPKVEIKFPNTNRYTQQLNVASRRNNIVDQIIYQYMYFQTPDEMNDYSPTIITGHEKASNFVRGFVRNTKDYIFKDLVVLRILTPDDLTEMYLEKSNQDALANQSKTLGVAVEDIENVIVMFYANDMKWLFCPQAVRYNGRWYLEALSGNLSSLIGIAYQAGGIMTAEEIDL